MVIGIDIDETITNTHDETLKYVKKYAPNLEFNDYCDDIKNKDVKAFLEKHAYNIQSNLTLNLHPGVNNHTGYFLGGT